MDIKKLSRLQTKLVVFALFSIKKENKSPKHLHQKIQNLVQIWISQKVTLSNAIFAGIHIKNLTFFYTQSAIATKLTSLVLVYTFSNCILFIQGYMHNIYVNEHKKITFDGL